VAQELEKRQPTLAHNLTLVQPPPPCSRGLTQPLIMDRVQARTLTETSPNWNLISVPATDPRGSISSSTRVVPPQQPWVVMSHGFSSMIPSSTATVSATNLFNRNESHAQLGSNKQMYRDEDDAEEEEDDEFDETDDEGGSWNADREHDAMPSANPNLNYIFNRPAHMQTSGCGSVTQHGQTSNPTDLPQLSNAESLKDTNCVNQLHGPMQFLSFSCEGQPRPISPGTQVLIPLAQPFTNAPTPHGEQVTLVQQTYRMPASTASGEVQSRSTAATIATVSPPVLSKPVHVNFSRANSVVPVLKSTSSKVGTRANRPHRRIPESSHSVIQQSGTTRSRDTDTPDESGVGESIISNDSPADSGGGGGGGGRGGGMAVVSAPCIGPTDDFRVSLPSTRACHSAMELPADRCNILQPSRQVSCTAVTPVDPRRYTNHSQWTNGFLPCAPNLPGTPAPPSGQQLLHMTYGVSQPLLRLNAQAMDQFATLPPQDRIGRYLDSLNEMDTGPSPTNLPVSSSKHAIAMTSACSTVPMNDCFIFLNYPPPPPPPTTVSSSNVAVSPGFSGKPVLKLVLFFFLLFYSCSAAVFVPTDIIIRSYAYLS
ncbi:uncharacterized protein DEA37_0005294, partial [Paragonimus westermani]